MVRQLGNVDKVTTTIRIDRSLREAARRAGLGLSKVLEEALRAQLEPSTYAKKKLAELQLDNEVDATKVTELTNRMTMRNREIEALKNPLNEEAPSA